MADGYWGHRYKGYSTQFSTGEMHNSCYQEEWQTKTRVARGSQGKELCGTKKSQTSGVEMQESHRAMKGGVVVRGGCSRYHAWP